MQAVQVCYMNTLYFAQVTIASTVTVNAHFKLVAQLLEHIRYCYIYCITSSGSSSSLRSTLSGRP
jgi:ligand-binding sensor protein